METQYIQVEQGVGQKCGEKKQNMSMKEEIMRIERAIADEADIEALAKQMGRTNPSVHGKISALKTQCRIEERQVHS